jgi:hypothetical protein
VRNNMQYFFGLIRSGITDLFQSLLTLLHQSTNLLMISFVANLTDLLTKLLNFTLKLLFFLN